MHKKPTYEELAKRIKELEKEKLAQENQDQKLPINPLTKSKIDLKTLIHAIPDLVWLKDKSGVYLSCNSRFENFFGAIETDIVGKTDNSFMTTELAEFFQKYDKIAIETRKASINEENITFANDGHQEILETIKIPVCGSDGQIAGVLGIGRDITKRKNIEIASRKNEEKLRLLFDKSPIGICTVDLLGNFIMTNLAYEHMLGYSKEELKMLSFYDITHPDNRPENKELFQKMFSLKSSGFKMEKVYIRKDGTEINVSIHATSVMDAEGNARFGTAFVEDITTTKRVREELTKSEQRLREAQRVASIGSWIQDNKSGRLTWSDETYRIFEVNKKAKVDEKELYNTFFSSIHPEDKERVKNAFIEAVKTKKPYVITHRLLMADGRIKHVHECCETEYDRNGNPIKSFGTVQDITHRIRADEEKEKLQLQLTQAQKLESVGRLAGGVAHDYNNISSIIIGYSELTLAKMETTNPLYSNITEILNAAKRSTEITRQLLAFARKQTIAPKILDINPSIENMLKILQRLIGEDICLKWQPGKDTWKIKIDSSQIDQILANLCINARDAITDVGNITIETSNASIDEQYCDAKTGFIPGDFVLIAVSDNGSGIEPEMLDKIFEPFFTTKGLGQGTGLGLATVYGIVKQNKGFINVYSELKKGTTIKIYIPRHKGQVVQSSNDSPSGIPLAKGEMILLVEDDSSILKLGKEMLTDLGYRVVSSRSPFQAIELARKHANEINMLITDVVMPEMNGRDLSVQAKALIPDLKILFMSGYTANVIAHRGVLDEGVNFLSKPFTKQGIAQKIRKVLRD